MVGTEVRREEQEAAAKAAAEKAQASEPNPNAVVMPNVADTTARACGFKDIRNRHPDSYTSAAAPAVPKETPAEQQRKADVQARFRKAQERVDAAEAAKAAADRAAATAAAATPDAAEDAAAAAATTARRYWYCHCLRSSSHRCRPCRQRLRTAFPARCAWRCRCPGQCGLPGAHASTTTIGQNRPVYVGR